MAEITDEELKSIRADLFNIVENVAAIIENLVEQNRQQKDIINQIMQESQKCINELKEAVLREKSGWKRRKPDNKNETINLS